MEAAGTEINCWVQFISAISWRAYVKGENFCRWIFAHHDVFWNPWQKRKWVDLPACLVLCLSFHYFLIFSVGSTISDLWVSWILLNSILSRKTVFVIFTNFLSMDSHFHITRNFFRDYLISSLFSGYFSHWIFCTTLPQILVVMTSSWIW